MTVNTNIQITPTIAHCVRAYIVARAAAEAMRKHVDQIEREVLEQCPLPNTHRHLDDTAPEMITDPKHVYLCENMDLLTKHYAEMNKRTRAAGLKPHDMPDDHCPALVLEHNRVKAEWLLLDEAAKMLGVCTEPGALNNRLLSMGIGKRQEMIDLLCRATLAHPTLSRIVERRA